MRIRVLVLLTAAFALLLPAPAEASHAFHGYSIARRILGLRDVYGNESISQ